jgi:5'-nucleotidase
MSTHIARPNPNSCVITVSARALFNLDEGDEIYVRDGRDAFERYSLANENKPLEPGPALPLIRKLLSLNAKLPEGAPRFDVVLLSRNSTETGIRVFKAIEKMKLGIVRAIFTSGAPTSNYIKALNAQLFLSSNPNEVAKVIKLGVGAATILPIKRVDGGMSTGGREGEQIRIAFDGDAVLFSDEAERVYHAGDLDAFQKHEVKNAKVPLSSGPLRGLLEVIHRIQSAFPAAECPVRTALVTARGAPAHMRAIHTLREWGVRVDEAMFLGGLNKGPFLQAFDADIFFDDSAQNIELAMAAGISSGHVPAGIRNEPGVDQSRFTGTTVVGNVLSDVAIEGDAPTTRKRSVRP